MPSADICQLACSLVGGCRYFIYDNDYKNCELLDSEDRDCDLILGPKFPLIDQCYNSSLSTSTTVATTPIEPSTPDSSTTTTDLTASQSSSETSTIGETSPATDVTTTATSIESSKSDSPTADTSLTLSTGDYSTTDIPTTYLSTTTTQPSSSSADTTTTDLPPTTQSSSSSTDTTAPTTTSTTTSESEDVSVHVLVLDAVNNDPIESVNITCTDASHNEHHVLTDDKGKAVCGRFPQGSDVSISGRHPRFEDLNIKARLEDSQDGRATFRLFLSPVLKEREELRGVFVWKNRRRALDLHLAEFSRIGSERPTCELSSR